MAKKTKGLKLPIQMTRQTTEVRIERVDDVVKFENDKAGISVHIEYDTWRNLDHPGVLIVTTLVPGLVPDETDEGE